MNASNPVPAAAAAMLLVDQVPAPLTRERARKWTEREDEKLREIISQQGARNWKDVSSHIPGRSHVQCLQRWNKVLKPGLKKGTWQPEEDELLSRYVLECIESGTDSPNWTSIAKLIEGRTAKQCRERWRCNLDPDIKKTDWTSEEDLMILNMQQALGNRWALLAKQLPGRTENAIKTRFRSLQRSLKRKWTAAEDEKIRSSVQLGLSFNDIAAEMPRRSVNSVKVRYKLLTEEGNEAVLPPQAASAPPVALLLPSQPFLAQPPHAASAAGGQPALMHFDPTIPNLAHVQLPPMFQDSSNAQPSFLQLPSLAAPAPNTTNSL